MTRLLVSLLLLLSLLPQPARAALLWVSPSLERTAAGCAEGADCARIRLTWPEFVRNLWPGIQRDIRGWVGYDPWANAVRSPFELTGAFLVAWDDWRRQAGTDNPTPWYIEREVTIVATPPALVGVCFMEHSYTGGDHPNSHRRYRMFRYGSGQLLTLDDLLQPDARPELDRQAENAFRAHYRLPPTGPLGADFRFDGDRFRLPKNLVLEAAGLRLYYNLYEIAPYATGPTELLLPWDGIRELIRPEFRP